MHSFIKALLFAGIAAIGNAVFVFGQKKSSGSSNPFLFLILSLTCCIAMLITASLFMPSVNVKNYIAQNYKSILLTAIGLFITYLGFYLLYSRFGASYYILYAVISIVTTSIIVGILFFKETFNLYYLLSIVSAVATIFLFYLGQNK